MDKENNKVTRRDLNYAINWITKTWINTLVVSSIFLIWSYFSWSGMLKLDEPIIKNSISIILIGLSLYFLYVRIKKSKK